ncbi:hypothetical protein BAE44_0007808 [Dichanthelium oligosanthes]|uniref:Uncharacterized protein n=1 Tax=Dichanthelium oligosanthes TaxID=888268 RepID=A0A1E5W195_9POAL|nr:hypothetical protein BAE44_0007808 [Dichanthelium oligosanthes]
MNFPLVAAVLLSGLLILGATEPTEAVCTVMCVQGVYMTCKNIEGNLTNKCTCQCKPAHGHGCVVYSANGTALERCSC